MVAPINPEWPDREYLEKVLIGGIEKVAIKIAGHDPNWALVFQRHAFRIKAALKGAALRIEHIGSTSVPELAAKLSI